MIVGNKIDLAAERTIDRQQGMKFAKQQRALYMETSAEANINVASAFEELVRKILDDNVFDDTNGVTKSDIRLSGSGGSEGAGGGGGSCGICS